MKTLSFLNILLAIAYGVYTGQITFAIIVGLVYLLGYVGLKIILRLSFGQASKYIYNLFFLIYGLLVLLSHIQLIHDPFEDFYVHNDAAWSFYKGIMTLVLPCDWSQLYERTIENPGYVQYPFAAFVMGAFAKLGQTLGIENLRLFLRVHIFLFGVFTITLMANLLEYYKYEYKRILKLIIPFGLFTYIYITSAIFSRDIYVALVYTIASYICLRDEIKFRLILFILLFFIAFGCRPQNGFIFLIYPICFYYKKLKAIIGPLGIVVILGVLLFISFYFTESIVNGVSSLNSYDERSLSNTGGLFIEFYTLPFPLNTLVVSVYMLIQPLPIGFYITGDGMTLLNIPMIFSPYLISLMLYVLYYTNTHKMRLNNLYALFSCFSLLAFFMIVYGSPDLRRAYAVIPGLYMVYCLTRDECPEYKIQIFKKFVWTIIVVINIIFVFYVYLR